MALSKEMMIVIAASASVVTAVSTYAVVAIRRRNETIQILDKVLREGNVEMGQELQEVKDELAQTKTALDAATSV